MLERKQPKHKRHKATKLKSEYCLLTTILSHTNFCAINIYIIQKPQSITTHKKNEATSFSSRQKAQQIRVSIAAKVQKIPDASRATLQSLQQQIYICTIVS